MFLNLKYLDDLKGDILKLNCIFLKFLFSINPQIIT